MEYSNYIFISMHLRSSHVSSEAIVHFYKRGNGQAGGPGIPYLHYAEYIQTKIIWNYDKSHSSLRLVIPTLQYYFKSG